jgi:tRNA A22 N-methylase
MVPLAIASLVVIPIAGLGGDFVIKLLARRNNGLHTVWELLSQGINVC